MKILNTKKMTTGKRTSKNNNNACSQMFFKTENNHIVPKNLSLFLSVSLMLKWPCMVDKMLQCLSVCLSVSVSLSLIHPEMTFCSRQYTEILLQISVCVCVCGGGGGWR